MIRNWLLQFAVWRLAEAEKNLSDVEWIVAEIKSHRYVAPWRLRDADRALLRAQKRVERWSFAAGEVA